MHTDWEECERNLHALKQFQKNVLKKGNQIDYEVPEDVLESK